MLASVVALVHRAADPDAPIGGRKREAHVGQDHACDDGGIAPVELQIEDGENQHEFNRGRHRHEHNRAHESFDGVAAAFEHTGQSADLALEMEAQRKQVKVNENVIGEPPDRMHRDRGKDRVARLGEARHGYPQDAIEERQRQRTGDDAQDPMRRMRMPDHRVSRPFEGIGDRNRHDLCDQHQSEGRQHAPFEVAATARPEIGPKLSPGFGKARAWLRQPSGRLFDVLQHSFRWRPAQRPAASPNSRVRTWRELTAQI